MKPHYFALEFAGADLDLNLNKSLLDAAEEGQRLLCESFEHEDSHFYI